MNFFITLSPVIQALIATIFTWGMTVFGAAGVFVFKKVSRRYFNAMLGFAAGVMIAASFWSLLEPSIALSKELGQISWLAPSIGFILGGIFLWGMDKLLPHLHIGLKKTESEGIHTSWRKTLLLFFAITLHNVPEGLAVGVAFGAVAHNVPGATLPAAIALAIGIGIQNFPEGFAVSMPFRREGFSKMKSFFYGQASALVEPIAGVVGAFAVMTMRYLLPYALAFAAGAMIYITIEEIIPEAQNSGSSDIATQGAMVGFVIMMILDVALG